MKLLSGNKLFQWCFDQLLSGNKLFQWCFDQLFLIFKFQTLASISFFNLKCCNCAVWQPQNITPYIHLHEPDHEKMCHMSYSNNKGADQPAHPRSLISTFVVRCLDSIISRFYSWNFKTLISFCGCAGRFVSGLVGNSRRHVLSCHVSHVVSIFWIMLLSSGSYLQNYLRLEGCEPVQ